MARNVLTGGAYQASSLIAGAQRCINLFPEAIPQQQEEPIPTVHLQTPGLDVMMQAQEVGPVRGMYRASNNSLYAAVNDFLFEIRSNFTERSIGRISKGITPVSMCDNGVQMVVVDGSNRGWSVDLQTGIQTEIIDPAFYGSDRVDLINTEFVFNRIGTRQFYLSDSIAITFDPLYISNKSGRQDIMISVAVVAGQLWLFGQDSTELWTYTGSADLPVQAIPGAVIEYGCAAKYSIGRTDKAVMWLSRSKDGQGIVLLGNGYAADRISTHAIEHEIAGYKNIEAAVGMTYQQQGHTFYVLRFAEATWAYDLATKVWHQWAWSDADGNLLAHRANCIVFWNDQIIVGDRENGKFYRLDPMVLTDDGAPIRRIRSFPHSSGAGKRVAFRSFIADLQVGDLDTTASVAAPEIFLRWSDDRGGSWSNPVAQTMGGTGQYLTRPTWRRLGISADRVWELSWSAQARTSLAGAFVVADAAST